MAELIYYAISSLDGYIEDADGTFGWAEPDEVVYSKTLQTASSARTRIERSFDPQATRQLKAASRP